MTTQSTLPVSMSPLPTLPGADSLHSLGVGSGAAPDEIRSAALEFESIFISALLKEMRQTVDGEGLFPGDTTDSMGGLFDQFMGQHLAAAGGIGLHEVLLNQFRGSVVASPDAATSVPQAAQQTTRDATAKSAYQAPGEQESVTRIDDVY